MPASLIKTSSNSLHISVFNRLTKLLQYNPVFPVTYTISQQKKKAFLQVHLLSPFFIALQKKN